MNKLRICLISQFYPPDTGGGGIAAYLFYLAHGLVQQGHQVHVISKSSGPARVVSDDGGVAVTRIPQWNPSYGMLKMPILGRHLRAFRNLFYSRRVSRELVRLRSVDIVEYADIEAEGFIFPRHLAIPRVVKLHTPTFVLERFYSRSELGYSTRLFAQMERQAVLAADAITSPSADLAAVVASEYRVDLQRIHSLPNGIDIDRFTPGKRSDHDLDCRVVVLCVGRLEPRKGADVFAAALVKAARREPRLRFVFLGADRRARSGASQRTEIRNLLAESGVLDKVEFHDHADMDTFVRFYQASDICVIPSLFENAPYTVLEAMSCGKALIASRTGGIPEMVEDGETGVLVPPWNADELADAIVRLANDEMTRSRLGTAARAKVLRAYAANDVASQTAQFYGAVIAARESFSDK